MKLKILPVTTAISIAAAPAAFAQGVSGSAPGQQQPKNYQGSPGSSYYAPGQEKKIPALIIRTPTVRARRATLPETRPPAREVTTLIKSRKQSEVMQLEGA